MPTQPLHRPLWPAPDARAVDILDQTALPHAKRILRLATLEDAAHAIRSMQVRGAPLIGVTAAYGIAFALAARPDDAQLQHALAALGATRPTAVNLHWALARMHARLAPLAPDQRADAAWQEAAGIAVADGSQVLVFKDLGLVSQVFDEQTLASMIGHVAVGHCRYSTTGSTTARGGFERRRGEGLGVGRTTKPAACKRFRNSRQASIFAVPVSVTQPRCSHSVAASSLRAKPGSHATVAQTSATSCALNSRPQCTQSLGVITSIPAPPPETQSR